MNEQLIGDLFAEATGRMTSSSSKEFSQKFAQLIVAECAKVIFETPVEYIEIDAMHRIRDNVKNHFGVEE